MSLTIGVDVGGTKIAAGLVDGDGRVLRRSQVSTPTGSVDALLEAIVALAAGLSAGASTRAVGVGAAAYVDRTRSRVLFAPNLPWRDLALREELERRLRLPVVIENDGNAAAWAEYRFGAGRGVEDQLMVAVGTGVGGGLVLDGAIYRGGHGVAAEIGHLGFVPDGLPCPCGRRGCLEQYTSGTALERRAREAAAAGEAPSVLARAGGDAVAVDGQMVTAAAQDGAADAIALFDAVGRDLGAGIASLVAVLDPSLVVLGGGVSEAGELLRAPVERGLAEQITGGSRRPWPRVVVAGLGNGAALVGAADLARSGRPRRATASSPQ